MIPLHLCKPHLSRAGRSLLLCVLAAVFLAPTAFAQRPLPTDTELRAAYCVRVLQSDIANLQSLRAGIDESVARINEVPPDLQQQVLRTLQESKRDLPHMISERETALNRVQLFILPRIPYLDSTALLAATRRADSDLQGSATVGSKCVRECSELKRGDGADDRSAPCMRACMGGELQSRLETCRNPMWLPF